MKTACCKTRTFITTRLTQAILGRATRLPPSMNSSRQAPRPVPSPKPIPSNIKARRKRRKAPNAGELFTVKVRYTLPQETAGNLITFPVTDAAARRNGGALADFTFAAAVAAFGMLLRNAPTGETPVSTRPSPWPALPWGLIHRGTAGNS